MDEIMMNLVPTEKYPVLKTDGSKDLFIDEKRYDEKERSIEDLSRRVEILEKIVKDLIVAIELLSGKDSAGNSACTGSSAEEY